MPRTGRRGQMDGDSVKELVIAVTCSNQDDKKIPINQSVRESHLHSANLCNIRHSSIWELVRDTDIVLV